MNYEDISDEEVRRLFKEQAPGWREAEGMRRGVLKAGERSAALASEGYGGA